MVRERRVHMLSRIGMLVMCIWATNVCSATIVSLPRYTASAAVSNDPASPSFQHAGVAVSASASVPPVLGTGGNANADGKAGPAGLGFRGYSALPEQSAAPDGPPISMTSSAGGQMRFQDVVIKNEADPQDTAPVEAAMRFMLDGVVDLETDPSANANARGSLLIVYGFGQGGAGSTAMPRNVGSVSWQSAGGDFFGATSGIFDGKVAAEAMSVSGLFETPVFEVPVGVPLMLTLQVSGGTVAQTGDGSPVSAEIDFYNTLSFPENDAVFNLPAGYTVDSREANIVGNRFVVPLPGGFVLLGSVLAALGFFASRRMA